MTTHQDQGTTIDATDLSAALDVLNRSMTACAGGIELADQNDDGDIRVRLTGMCTGCSCRMITAAATIRPTLTSVRGVRNVELVNGRISPHAERRLEAAFADAQIHATAHCR